MAYWLRTDVSYASATNAAPHEIAFLDVNGDGFQDFVCANLVNPADGSSTAINVLINDGSGGFTQQTTAVFGAPAPQTVHPRDLSIADFNGDGRDDLFVADHGYDAPPFPGAPNLLLLSSGAAGMIDASDRLPGYSDFTHSSTCGDIDGDGDIDILAGNVNVGEAPIYFLVNDGAANFTVDFDRLPAREALGGAYFTTCLLFDADGDGDNDLMLGQAFGEHPSEILFNDGTGQFGDAKALPPGGFGLSGSGAMEAVPADIDGDGDLDLIVDLQHNYEGHLLQILVNDGAGGFTDETASRLPQRLVDDGRWIVHVQAVDLNGDGALDLLATNGLEAPAFLNDGSGHFINLPKSYLDLGGWDAPMVSTRAFDADGDGRMDILADYGGGVPGVESFYLFLQQNPGLSQTGTTGADALLGDTSAERLNGRGGADVLFGAQGDDTLIGGGAGDTLIGGLGKDSLSGGDGADFVGGGPGGDRLNGGAGLDTLSYRDATAGVVVSLAKAGALDTKGGGTDTLSGFEALIGSRYNDTLTGRAGADTITGGAGNDKLAGGGGFDWASYAGAAAGVSVTLASAKAQNTGGAGKDVLAGFEGLIGSDHADHLSGSTAADALDGGAGNDILLGGQGNDTLRGGDGVDAVSFADAGAAITLTFSGGALTVAGLGTDSLASIEGVIGSAFNDRLSGSKAGDLLGGGGGGDTLEGGKGDDTLRGGAGGDRLTGGDGFDIADYSTAKGPIVADLGLIGRQNTGEGKDVLSSVEGLIGSAFADRIAASAADGLLVGGAGDDTIFSGGGHDTVEGGDGFDILSFARMASAVAVDLMNLPFTNGGDTVSGIEGLTGSAFEDYLSGDWGANRIDGGAGFDFITGQRGADTLAGGADFDVFYYRFVEDSRAGEADVITDLGGDQIQLQLIDADVAADGDQAFTLIEGEFTGAAGELRLRYVAEEDRTYLEGEVDGDAQADLVIILLGDHRGFDAFFL